MSSLINNYVCLMGHTTVTTEPGYGVTPMSITCPVCNDTAVSMAYNVDQNETPGFEWYAPKFPERIAHIPLRFHVEHGGLMLRRIGTLDETEVMPELPKRWDGGEFSDLAEKATKLTSKRKVINRFAGHKKAEY